MSHSIFTLTQKQQLENTRKILIARYEATFNQRENMIGDGDKVLLTNQLNQLETEIKEVEAQLLSLEIDEVRCLERNQAYSQALAQWKEIQKRAPNDIQVSQAIQDVQEKIDLKNRVIDIQKRLAKHFKVLGATYLKIDARLRRMKKEGVDDENETLLDVIEQFLNQKISADDLVVFLSSLDQQPTKTSTDTLNYQALADRLRRGDIVIFLGTDLLPSLCEQTLSSEQIVSDLAEYVHYPDFSGDFPGICEYIDMNNQFGQQ